MERFVTFCFCCALILKTSKLGRHLKKYLIRTEVALNWLVVTADVIFFLKLATIFHNSEMQERNPGLINTHPSPYLVILLESN